MRTVRILPLGLLGLTLCVSSCKKSSNDPTPNDPTVITGCKPMSETNLATGDTITRYAYDTQGRVSLVKGKRNGPFGTESYSSTITYLNASQIVVRTLVGTGPYPTTERDTYSFVSGQVSSSINENGDTTFYIYDSGNLKTITQRVHSWDSTVSVTHSRFTYGADGMLNTVTESFDSSGVNVPYMTTTYTYDTKAVSFVPLNPYSIAPGLDLIKLTKLILKAERVQFHDYQGFQAGFYTETVNYTPVYDGEKVSQITLTGSAVNNNRVSKFAYMCK